MERIKQSARSIRAAIRNAIESAVREARKWRVAYLRSHAYEGRRVHEYVSAQIRWWERYER